MASIVFSVLAFDALAAQLESMGQNAKDIHEVIGRQAANDIKAHLVQLNANRKNKLGGPRFNFFARASESVSVEAAADQVAVSVTQPGFALRYFGGTVRPTKKKALAIPARAEAYGLGPQEPSVPELTPFFFKGRNAFAGLKDANDQVWYWLVRETTHQPDPTVLPTDEALQAGASDALQMYIEALFEEATQP